MIHTTSYINIYIYIMSGIGSQQKWQRIKRCCVFCISHITNPLTPKVLPEVPNIAGWSGRAASSWRFHWKFGGLLNRLLWNKAAKVTVKLFQLFVLGIVQLCEDKSCPSFPYFSLRNRSIEGDIPNRIWKKWHKESFFATDVVDFILCSE